MKKYKCTNMECKYSCELRSDLFPHKCVCWDYIPQWVEMDGTEPVTESNQLPKLTAEVFDREDCPEDAKIAIVNKDGSACFGSFASATPVFDGWGGDGDGEWKTIPGKWDASDWKNSFIERPAKLPEWCKVGEYGYAYDSGYFKIAEIIDGGRNLKVDWVKEGVQGTVFGCNLQHKKQARLRPYNAEEMRGLVGKVIEDNHNAHLVIGLIKPDPAENVSCFVRAGQSWITSDKLLQEFTIDGKPCGKMEHLENGEWVE